MITQNNNPDTAKVRAFRDEREVLLRAVGGDATALDTSASRLARHVLQGIREGVTTIADEQLAVCKRFPLRTASGKVSKTPNGKIKATWDKIVMLTAILQGESKTYSRPEAFKLVERFIAEEALKLNTVWQAIRDDKAAAAAEVRAAMSDEEKAAEKAAKEAADNEAMAGAVANSAAMLLALAAEIDAYTVAEHGALIDPLGKVHAAIEAFNAKVEAAATPEQLAA